MRLVGSYRRTRSKISIKVLADWSRTFFVIFLASLLSFNNIAYASESYDPDSNVEQGYPMPPAPEASDFEPNIPRPKTEDSYLVAAGDLDGDSIDEVVIGREEGVWAFEGEGTPVDGWPSKGDLVFNGDFPIAVADVVPEEDGDVVRDEVIAVGSVFDDGSEPYLCVLDGTGNTLYSWPLSYEIDNPKEISLAIADFSGSQTPEIIVGANSYSPDIPSTQLSAQSTVAVFTLEGEVLYRAAREATILNLSIGDIDNDGQLEMVSVYNSFDPDKNRAVVKVSILGPPQDKYDRQLIIENEWVIDGAKEADVYDVALGDLDKDKENDLEIALSIGNNVFAYHHTGEILHGFPIELNEEISSPILGDINKDGITDVIVVASSGLIYAWDRNGKILPGWPKKDGYSDLVISKQDNGPYILKLNTTTYNTDAMDWPMYRHDAGRSGSYGPRGPSTYSISGQILDHDEEGLRGVTVRAGATRSATTDENGNYTITGLQNGTYNVTPSKLEYIFDPVSRSVTIDNANVTGQNFTAFVISPSTYSISGRVTLNGPGLQDVTISATNGGGSTTTDSSGNYTISGLQNGTYTLTPSYDGYTFIPTSRTVTINDAHATGRDFTARAATYFIIATAGIGGEINPNGMIRVIHGEYLTLNITPNRGYQIADVLVDGASVGAIATYTFNNIIATHTIHATFSLITHTITATAGIGGSISTSGNVSVNPGANQTFTITPNANYRIADVLVDGASVGAVSTYTFTDVTADHRMHAAFNVITHTITAIAAGAGGSISPSGNVSVNPGANQTFTITANAAGYRITDVLVDRASVGPVSTYTFINVIANHSITAICSRITHTITATAGTGGNISPSGNVSVNPGSNQTFTITPNTGYQIADVLVDGASVGAPSAYAFINVTANHTIHATFNVIVTN